MTAVRERVQSPKKTVYPVVSLALSLLCLFRYKPSREVGTFHENSSRLRAHGVQRCVHLPYVPPAALALAGEPGAWRGTSNSQRSGALVLRAS